MPDKFDARDAAKFIENTAKSAVDVGVHSSDAADTLQKYLASLSSAELTAVNKQLKWDNHIPSMWSETPTVELKITDRNVSARVTPSVFDLNADCTQLNLSVARNNIEI